MQRRSGILVPAAIAIAIIGFSCIWGIYAQSNNEACGDVDGDQQVVITDAVYLINYIFAGGPAPDPLSIGDCDLNGSVDIGDAVWLVNYIFAGGLAPCVRPIELYSFCLDGRPFVIATNNFDDQMEPESFTVFYETGDSSTGYLQLLESEADTIGISNMYGSCIFRVDETGYEIAIEDCLSPYVDSLIRVADFEDYIMNPVFEDFPVDLGLYTCNYDFYLDSLAFDSAAVELTFIPGGLIMETHYFNLSADFEIDATPALLCPGGSGSFTIDSLLVCSEFTYNVISSDSVDVELDTTTTVVMFEADIMMEGALAAYTGPEFTINVEDTTSPLGAGMVAVFQALAEPLLESLLKP